MQPKTSFYFVLYIVVVVDLLAVVTERDYWLDSITRAYEKPLTLSVPATSQWVTSRCDSIVIHASDLQNDQEKSDMRYFVRPSHPESISGVYSEEPTVNPLTGSGTFAGTFDEPGDYRFVAWAELPRRLPDDVGGIGRTVRSDTVRFALTVQKDPVPATKFAMAVDKNHDNWITGIRYEKHLFINADPAQVELLGLPKGFRRGSTGTNTIQLLWDRPTRGRTRVSLHGLARRGLAPDIDSDALAFTIDVDEPNWNPEPGRVAYWKVPFVFSSRVGGLESHEYVIDVLANEGSPVATITAKNYPYKITPEQTWTSLTFRARSANGAEIMTKSIPVHAPPPPQIEWSSSGLKGTDYVVQFACRDITGGDVDVRYEVLSPAGITSRLDPPVRGTSFTLVLRDVTKARPQYVTLRVSARGISQTPSRPLDKTFVLLY
ncbi:MAG: hypothetical protein OEM41_05675 [Ignavibacteria bacterium]|nr:hypothetical protein [Ignavibacteria bacterium]